MVSGATAVEPDRVFELARSKAAVPVAALLVKVWLARRAASEVLVAAGAELTLFTPLPPSPPHPASADMPRIIAVNDTALRYFIIAAPCIWP
jgi:hypothetical protein